MPSINARQFPVVKSPGSAALFHSMDGVADPTEPSSRITVLITIKMGDQSKTCRLVVNGMSRLPKGGYLVDGQVMLQGETTRRHIRFVTSRGGNQAMATVWEHGKFPARWSR